MQSSVLLLENKCIVDFFILAPVVSNPAGPQPNLFLNTEWHPELGLILTSFPNPAGQIQLPM